MTFGPWITTADEVPDPHALGIRGLVNGELRQNASTTDFSFDSPQLIETISAGITLYPGDLIATGTPERLSGPMGPERHLQAGDEVTAWIEGIGELTTIIA